MATSGSRDEASHDWRTPAPVARLRRIFPEGVCDWSRAGVWQRELLDTWITFTDVGECR